MLKIRNRTVSDDGKTDLRVSDVPEGAPHGTKLISLGDARTKPVPRPHFEMELAPNQAMELARDLDPGVELLQTALQAAREALAPASLSEAGRVLDHIAPRVGGGSSEFDGVRDLLKRLASIQEVAIAQIDVALGDKAGQGRPKAGG